MKSGSRNRNMYFFFRRTRFQYCPNFLCNLQQVHGFCRYCNALIQLINTDNILNEIHQPFGFPADMAHESRGVRRLDHAAFQQLRTADDAL